MFLSHSAIRAELDRVLGRSGDVDFDSGGWRATVRDDRLSQTERQALEACGWSRVLIPGFQSASESITASELYLAKAAEPDVD